MGMTFAVIATHPKSGTVMCREVFEAYAKEFSLKFYNTDDDRNHKLTADFDIVHHEGIYRNSTMLLKADFKGIHIVRDLRDQVISGTFFYRELPPSEYMLFKPLECYNGKTYAEMIQDCDTLEKQIDCTYKMMYHLSFQDILNWDYDDTRYMTVQYEKLVHPDTYISEWSKCLSFLEVNNTDWLMKNIIDNNIYNPNKPKTKHIRDGSHKQWKKYFSEEQNYRINNDLSDILVKLGYEKST